MIFFRKATASAIDAGGSRGMSDTKGDCASGDDGTLLLCCTSTFDASGMKDERRGDVSSSV
jgi:hypothetical protein